MIALSAAAAALTWCVRQGACWMLMGAWILAWWIRVSPVLSADVGDPSRDHAGFYSVAFVAAVPGAACGILAYRELRALLRGAEAFDGLLSVASILTAASLPFVASAVLITGLPDGGPSLSAILIAGSSAVAVLAWAGLCGLLRRADIGAVMLFLAGDALVALFPPAASAREDSATLLPLLSRVLPILGLLLACWLQAPARTSHR